MFVQYTQNGNTVMVITTREEYSAYTQAGVPFPPKDCRFRWDSELNAWTRPADAMGPRAEVLNRLFDAIKAGAAVGLPGLTPELARTADRPAVARQPQAPRPVEARQPLNLPAAATYTVVTGSEYWTIRLEEPWAEARVEPGTLTVSYLCGSDNETDFRGFGFVSPTKGFTPWRKYADPEVLSAYKAAVSFLLAADAAGHAAGRETYALRSGRCARCGRTLTVPASLHAGMGPDCAAKLGG